MDLHLLAPAFVNDELGMYGDTPIIRQFAPDEVEYQEEGAERDDAAGGSANARIFDRFGEGIEPSKSGFRGHGGRSSECGEGKGSHSVDMLGAVEARWPDGAGKYLKMDGSTLHVLGVNSEQFHVPDARTKSARPHALVVDSDDLRKGQLAIGTFSASMRATSCTPHSRSRPASNGAKPYVESATFFQVPQL